MDHVRGSSLAWPASLETLRPFIVTWWSGRTTSDMPADVAAVFAAAGFRQSNVNLGLVVLDSKGQVLRASVPRIRPPSFGFDPDAQGRDFKSQLDELLDGLKLPVVAPPAKPKLTLPDVIGKGQPAGVRIFLAFSANRLNQFRSPIVEAVSMTDELRKSLRYPSAAATVTATELRPWLEQIYPAAIMDGHGGFRKIEGNLVLKPAGADDAYRYAVIEGDVEFVLDNAGASMYHASVSVVLKYRRADSALH